MRAFMAIRCQVSARHSGPSDIQHQGPPRLRLADYVGAARNCAVLAYFCVQNPSRSAHKFALSCPKIAFRTPEA